MPKVTLIVGGSIGCAGKGAPTDRSAIVSATVAFDMPDRLTMSPASAASIGTRARPRNARIFETRNRSISLPSRASACTVAPAFSVPVSTRPVRSRPRNGSAASVVASIENGSPRWATCFGDGT